LFLWLSAVKNYYYVYQETTPKRDSLFYAEKQLMLKEREIKKKREELERLHDDLDAMKVKHQRLEGDVALLQK